jgi:hypothetical protein
MANDKLGYSAMEDDRLQRLIEDATKIYYLAYNAEGLTNNDNFNAAFKTFFNKHGTSMQLLLAKPGTPFYNDMAAITGAATDPQVFRLEVEKNEKQLAKLAGKTSKIEVRRFDSQLRLPLILIESPSGGEYCILTVRLPPAKGGESIRLEFSDDGLAGNSYVSQCAEDFNAIWSVAKEVKLKQQ